MTTERHDTLRARLEAAHDQLQAVLDRVDDDGWGRLIYSDGAEWTVRDLVGHLLDAEAGMGFNIGRIQRGGTGSSDDFDLNRWNNRSVEKGRDRTLEQLRDGLNAAHAYTLRLLAGMGEDDWAKEGRQAFFGTLPLEKWFKVIAGHKRQHADDIAHLLGITL